MATTYVKIASVTVGSGGAANIEFTSIPGTYTDLLILHSTRSDYNAINSSIYVAPNSASTNLSSRSLHSSSSTVASATYTSIIGRDITGATATASTFGNGSIYLPNYAGNTNKSVSLDTVGENNASSVQYLRGIQAGLWSSTAAITSIKITTDGNFVQHSTATLYGIKNS